MSKKKKVALKKWIEDAEDHYAPDDVSDFVTNILEEDEEKERNSEKEEEES